LVLVGLGVGLIPGVPAVHVAPNVVLLGVLPPLLLASAEELDLPALRAVWRVVVVLATVLVLATAAATASVAHGVNAHLGLGAAFVLGAILASTDPVAVSALSRRLHLPVRMRAIVSAESLFNDATSLVLFQVAVAVVSNGHLDGGDVAVRVVRLGLGGLAVGAVVGGAAAPLLRRVSDRATTFALGVLVPYGAAFAAWALGCSSVTAVIVAGLLIGAAVRRSLSPASVAVRRYTLRGLEWAVFVLVGLELAGRCPCCPAGCTGRRSSWSVSSPRRSSSYAHWCSWCAPPSRGSGSCGGRSPW
jgi:NhaP-type Na+/H+ or K+/H+ antiporter